MGGQGTKLVHVGICTELAATVGVLIAVSYLGDI
jgi:hypothetical protein